MTVDPTLSRAEKDSGSPPTVLQVVPRLDAGGAERIVVELAAALAAAGGRALIAGEAGRLVDELAARGGTWIPLKAASKNPATMLANGKRLARIATAEGVDVIHAHSRAPAWSALLAARRTTTSFVTSFHGAYRQTNALKAAYNSVMAKGDAVIANSRFTAAVIGERFPAARDRIVVIPGGIDEKRFDPAAIDDTRIQALREAWGIAPETRVVLVPARLSPVKGQRVAIAAARDLADIDDLVVILAGDDQTRRGYAEELAREITVAGLEGRVRLVGHCDDIPAALRLADVAAVPSLVPETFGLAAVEAEAAGCPVIVSDVGAYPETVLAPPEAGDAERTGWRVPPGDRRALAAAIREAFGLTPEARAALIERARAHVLPRYSIAAMTAATIELYARLGRRR